MAHIRGLSLFVAQAFFVREQHDIFLFVDTSRNILSLGEINRLWNIVNAVDILSFSQLVAQFYDRLFAHTIYNKVGTRIAQDATHQLVLPIVVVRNSAHRSLYTAKSHRHIRIDAFENLGVDDSRIFRATVVATIRAVCILATQTLVGSILIHHRVHAARRNTEKQAWLTQLLEVAEVAMPVGLRHNSHSIARSLKRATYHGSTERRVVYISICRKKDYIKFVPSTQFAFLLCGRKKIR